MSIRTFFAVLKETAVEWYEHDAQRQAAALACYALLSMAPLVLFSVALAGLVFGEEAARGQIAQQIGGVVGETAASAIQGIAKNAHQAEGGVLGSIIGIGVLLFGASGVFGELQTALNQMWEVKPKPGRGVVGFVRDRFLSFTMVLSVAFLLLVSLLLSTALAAVGRFFADTLPGGAVVWEVLNFLIQLGVVAFLFALVFKVVPDVEIGWRDVWVGAVGTAVLFSIGKWGLAMYLGRSTVASTYGAAGSVVALVIWVYYASQILFMGAELTQVYSRRAGSRIRPSPNAVFARTPAPTPAPPAEQSSPSVPR